MNELIQYLIENTDAVYMKLINFIIGATTFNQEPRVIAFIYSIVMPAGLALALSFSLYEILTTVMQRGENISAQMIIPPLIKAVLCFVLITQGGKLIGMLLSMSNTFADRAEITGIMSGITDTTINLTNDSQAAKYGAIQKVLVFIACAIAKFGGMFNKIKLFLMVIGTKIEICIRMGLMPIAIANICMHEHHGGLVYVKKTLGSALYMFGILVSIIGVASVIGGTIGSVMGSGGIAKFSEFVLLVFVAEFAGPAACVALAKQIKGIIDSALS